MATKRSADVLESESRPTFGVETKRVRLSPTMDGSSNSSNPSICSVSEDTALRSSPITSEQNRQSSVSSLQSSGDADSESYWSSSSEESSEAEEAENIVRIGGPKRPHINKDSALDGAQDLQARLAALLPRLQAANQELAGDDHGWNMEDVEEGEQHIEMDLGLGVLEEAREGDSESSEESSDSDVESGVEEFEDGPSTHGVVPRARDRKDTDVMRKLMGRQKISRKPDIEDLG